MHGLPAAQDEVSFSVPVSRSNREVTCGAADPLHCTGPVSSARSPAIPVTVSFPARPISSTVRTGPLVSATLREPPPLLTSGGRPSAAALETSATVAAIAASPAAPMRRPRRPARRPAGGCGFMPGLCPPPGR